jgi:hypothetical protein
VQQALQEPPERLRPIQARGRVEGLDLRAPIPVMIVRHFYHSSQTSGFRESNNVDSVGPANDDISPEA